MTGFRFVSQPVTVGNTNLLDTGLSNAVTIEKCTFLESVEPSLMFESTIRGDVTTNHSGQPAGGIIGTNYDGNGVFSYCENYGTIFSAGRVDQIVGWKDAVKQGKVISYLSGELNKPAEKKTEPKPVQMSEHKPDHKFF